MRDEATGYHYKHAESSFMKSLFDYNIKYKLTQEEMKLRAAQKKAQVDRIEKNTFELIKSAAAQAKFSKVSSDVFRAIIPPKAAEKTLDINEWFRVMCSKVKHTRPFIDMLSAHASKLRDSKAHMEKIYAIYDSFGNTGKNYLMACLASVYGAGRPNISVKTDGIESDKFNDWMSCLKMLNVDEAQNTNYRSHKFESWLKLATNYSMNFRGIQKEAVEKPVDFITSFTTNTPDLYGMIRSINPDYPLLSRIAIIEASNVRISKSYMCGRMTSSTRKHRSLSTHSVNGYEKNS
jgi:hypothetical protein